MQVRPEDVEAVRRALDEARRAGDSGEVPIGAVVLDATGEVIGVGRNEREATHDPTAHAEVVALRAASAALGSWRLDGCTLAVTLEPCTMCAGAPGSRPGRPGRVRRLGPQVRRRRLALGRGARPPPQPPPRGRRRRPRGECRRCSRSSSRRRTPD